ncbi:MAG: hypothetical protein ACPGQS_04675 [Bradymonadia bacterium]
MIQNSIRIVLVITTLAGFLGCDDGKEEQRSASCVICIEQPNEDVPPYIDCDTANDSDRATYCENEDGMTLSCESVEICCDRAPLGSTGCSTVSREPVDVVPIVNQSIAAVPGNIIFTGTYDNETHVYSVDRATAEIYQLSVNDAQYRAVSVGPDRRFFLYSKIDSADRSSVWLYDLQGHTSKAISPEGCDAGRDGVGWFNDTFVGFAMKCDEDEYRQAYLANIYDDNQRAFLRQLTDQPGDVVEVYPILNSTFFLYALVTPPCDADGCMVSSTIWMGDNEITEQQCAITEVNASDDNPERTITDTKKRLGDFRPSIAANLQSIIFSRVVGAKPEAPLGHHDLWTAGTNVRALLAGNSSCSTDPPTSLTQALSSDRWVSQSNTLSILSEYSPTLAFDDASSEISHIFVGSGDGNNEDSGIFEASIDGSLRRWTPTSLFVLDGTWVQDELNLTGSR